MADELTEDEIILEREKYVQKDECLATYGDETEPLDFYRELFPLGSFQQKGVTYDGRGNGIAQILTPDGKKALGRLTVTDDLDAIKYLIDSPNLVITYPVSFFGKRAILDNAHEVFGIAIDLDYVGMDELQNLLYEMEQEVIPKATYLVNSGTGIHLYYLFTEPIPLNKTSQNMSKIGILKHAITQVVWNRYTSTQAEIDGKDVRQYHGVTHGFRLIGGLTKLGEEYRVKAYAYGDRVEYSRLIDYAVDRNKEKKNRTVEALTVGIHKTTPLAQAAEKWPDWYSRVILNEPEPEGAPPHLGRWVVKRDLYDWWLRKIREGATVGHRYFCIMCLAVYAVKCGVDEDELHDDAMSLVPYFNSMSQTDPFTAADVESALRAYEDDYVTFPRDTISRLSAIPLTENKRNGRKQSEHLKRARAVRDVDHPDGSWRNTAGRPSVGQRVASWRQKHPDGSKSACRADTGLSYPTIRKWWDTPITEDNNNEVRSEDGHIVVTLPPDVLNWDDQLDQIMAQKNKSSS